MTQEFAYDCYGTILFRVDKISSFTVFHESEEMFDILHKKYGFTASFPYLVVIRVDGEDIVLNSTSTYQDGMETIRSFCEAHGLAISKKEW